MKLKKYFIYGILTSLILGIISLSVSSIILTTHTVERTIEKPQSQRDKIELNFETLEIADEDWEHAQGLMKRNNLCRNCGMLFAFKEEKYLSFWMKNTYISLDIIFINEHGRIVSISENTKPESEYPVYESEEKAQYVLEINGGLSQKLNLERNLYLDLDYLKNQAIEFVE